MSRLRNPLGWAGFQALGYVGFLRLVFSAGLIAVNIWMKRRVFDPREGD